MTATTTTRVREHSGCGIGGPARYLAATFGCLVTGVDLSPGFIDAATYLTARCEHGSLSDRFLWSFVASVTPIARGAASIHELPIASPESEALTKALRKRVFTLSGRGSAEESGSAKAAFFAVSRRAMCALAIDDLVAADALIARTAGIGAELGEPDVEAC